MSPLRFLSYSVENLEYKSLPDTNEANEIELQPDIRAKLIKKDDRCYDLSLSVSLAPEEDRSLPFEIKITLVGHFEFSEGEDVFADNRKEQILRQNTVAILFPFLRSTLAAVTTIANIPPVILPVINFAEEKTVE